LSRPRIAIVLRKSAVEVLRFTNVVRLAPIRKARSEPINARDIRNPWKPQFSTVVNRNAAYWKPLYTERAIDGIAFVPRVSIEIDRSSPYATTAGSPSGYRIKHLCRHRTPGYQVVFDSRLPHWPGLNRYMGRTTCPIS
jgi:hypothetical protein